MNAVRVRHLENSINTFDHVVNSKQPIDLFLKRYFNSHKMLGSSDKAWIADHFYELQRWRGLLDYVTPPPTTWSTRLRTYFISDRWRAHTMNDRLPPHVRGSFPEDLFKRLENAYGTKKALQLCHTSNESAPTFLRINPLKARRDQVYRYLSSKGVTVEKSVNSPLGLQLGSKHRLLDLPEYSQGFFEIQDESSQLIAQKVEVKPGDLILDYCAGSGGKSLILGSQLENKGRIYLHDVKDYLLADAKQRLRKAGIRNFVTLSPRDPQLEKIKKKMDWVIVDPPCSATGVLRRNPDMKWNFTNSKLFDWVALQREIFANALSYMKPEGGKIVYSTASILDEENIQQVKYFCHKHGLYLSEPPFHALPQSNGMDGFFCAIMESKSSS